MTPNHQSVEMLGTDAFMIGRLIQDQSPDRLKLPFYPWTRKAVGHLIAKKFGVRLSVWTVGRLLTRWGFTPQKPLRQAYERNPKTVARWLTETFPQIKRWTKRYVQLPAKAGHGAERKHMVDSTRVNHAKHNFE